jgi:hypothetical protein
MSEADLQIICEYLNDPSATGGGEITSIAVTGEGRVFIKLGEKVMSMDTGISVPAEWRQSVYSAEEIARMFE